jgi:hypothetical protein
MAEDPPPNPEDSQANRPEVQKHLPEHREDNTPAPSRGIQEIFAAAMQFGPPRHPLQEKITEAHVTEILSIQREGMKHAQTNKEGERKHQTTLCVIACGFVLLLVGLLVFTGNAALTEKVVIGLVSFAGGAFGGYGVGRRQKD